MRAAFYVLGARQRVQHESAVNLLTIANNAYRGFCYHELSAGFYDTAASNQLGAPSRAEKVDLELGGEALFILFQNGIGGVAGSGIRNCCHHAAMKKTMLLARRFAEWKMNLHVAGLNIDKFSVERGHHALMKKTLANLLLKILIGRHERFSANCFKGSHIKPFQ